MGRARGRARTIDFNTSSFFSSWIEIDSRKMIRFYSAGSTDLNRRPGCFANVVPVDTSFSSASSRISTGFSQTVTGSMIHSSSIDQQATTSSGQTLEVKFLLTIFRWLTNCFRRQSQRWVNLVVATRPSLCRHHVAKALIILSLISEL